MTQRRPAAAPIREAREGVAERGSREPTADEGAGVGGSGEHAAGIELPGFPDVETGLVCLTHAAKGFFRRSDGKIGLNRVWHKRIPVQSARLLRASFPLLERLELVSAPEQSAPYSVLLAPEIGFVSHLPPQIVRS